MKVLHVLNHSLPHVDGYSVRSSQIVHAQKSNGLDVVVCTSPKQEPVPSEPVEEINGVRYYRATRPVGRWPRYFDELVSIRCLRKRLAEVIEAESPDIVHAHSPCLWGVSARQACRRYKLPLVYEIRAFWEDCVSLDGTAPRWTLKYGLTRALETWVARKANAVTAIATHLRDDLRNRGIPETKLFVVPNGVDTTKFIPRSTDENLRAELAFNGDICLGYLGSLYPWEGVDDLLNAMVIVARQNPAIKLLIVGGGEEHARLKSMVDAQGLGHCVRMQGQIPHADVLRYYSIMDVMVYPRKRSRVTELVTPLKPLEAMAMSKPIVATDVGGLRELLGENGTVYCNADDPNDLAMKCLQLVNAGATERERLGAIGKRYVAENKSWLKIATLYDAVYEFAKQHRVS